MREAVYNRRLLTREDRKKWVIRYDLSAYDRGNTAARTGYFTAMRAMGAMSADDVRRREGMNPIGPEKGGDLYTVQAQRRPSRTSAKNRRSNRLSPHPPRPRVPNHE